MYFYCISLFFGLLCLLFLLMLNYTFMNNMIFIIEWNMLNMNFSMDVKFYVYFDFMSNMFLLVISLITMVTFYYSKFYMSLDKFKMKFILLTFMFVISMFIVVMGLNFYMIFIGWDMLGLISYFLVIHYNSDNSYYCGLITILTNRIGDISFMFMLIFFINMNLMDLVMANLSQEIKYLCGLCLLTSAFTKSSQFPFSSWLPLAMAAPTPISALVHSSTLVTAGVYLLIRFNCLFMNNMNFSKNVLCLIGLTLLISSCSACSEVDIKKIIAYSTLSQLSLMMMILLMGESMISFFHILTHALFKASLFLCSGFFIHENYENQDIRKYKQYVKIDPFVSSVFCICNFSLMGFPFLSGFYSKDLILEYMYAMNFNLFYIIFLIFCTFLTSLYTFRLMYYSMMLVGNLNKFNYLENWNKMSNSFILLFIFVLLSGSMIMWLMYESFFYFYLKIEVKIINMLYIIMALICLKWVLGTNKFKTNKFFVMMFYTTSIQGFLFNGMLEKCNVFYNHYESYIEMLVFSNLKNFVSKISYMNMMIKYIMIFNIFIVILFMFMYNLQNIA
uniref:NADH dehydrogenase subunit 5 n=1 Tax=Neoseiulus chebalingensis TaxID=3061192 RepID=UPI0030FEBB71